MDLFDAITQLLLVRVQYIEYRFTVLPSCNFGGGVSSQTVAPHPLGYTTLTAVGAATQYEVGAVITVAISCCCSVCGLQKFSCGILYPL